MDVLGVETERFQHGVKLVSTCTAPYHVPPALQHVREVRVVVALAVVVPLEHAIREVSAYVYKAMARRHHSRGAVVYTRSDGSCPGATPPPPYR